MNAQRENTRITSPAGLGFDAHASRWYDACPRLGFAFQMMEFAPVGLRASALNRLRESLADFLGAAPAAVPAPVRIGQRWYDVPTLEADAATDLLMRLIETGPDAIKTRAADTLLEFLHQQD